MNEVLAMILAGGTGERLSLLVAERAKPAVPFAGRYRIIDFTLSNCVNSGIYKVAVLTQYNPRSLAQHIGIGKPWDLDRTNGGVFILQPYLGRVRRDWYHGTADAVYQNLYFIEDQKVKYVLILAGDHVYTMRYDRMFYFHLEKKADLTIGVVPVSSTEELSRMGVVQLDAEDRIVDFEEKPSKPKTNLASMGIYLFNKDILISCLEEIVPKGGYDFGKDVIPKVIKDYRVYGYLFKGYWRDIGTIFAYWQANMDLIVDLPQFNLYDPEMPILTSSRNKPPAKTGPFSHITRSLISDGCIINGIVKNSVLSPGVYVEKGAQVLDSVIFDDTYIGKESIVEKCIIDKGVQIGEGCHLGYGDDYTPNKEEPHLLNSGITLVGKGAKIPSWTKIGRNCKIGCWVEFDDFPSLFIPSGSSVSKKTPKRFQI